VSGWHVSGWKDRLLVGAWKDSRTMVAHDGVPENGPVSTGVDGEDVVKPDVND
jgi:hypothetical protein